MEKKFFWGGLTLINVFCSFSFSFLAGTVLFLVAGAAWWGVVYRSGFLS